MMEAPAKLMAAAAILAAGVSSVGAAGTGRQARFVKRFVEALNSRDPDAQKELVHPGSRACAGGPAVSFFDELHLSRARPLVADEHEWEITPARPDAPPLFADKFDYPVMPSHLLRIDFQTGPTRSTTFVVQIIEQEDRWYVAAACPKPETIAAAEAVSQSRAERAERLRRLEAGIPPQLKETVLRLVTEGRRVDAILEYRRATGEDLAIARDVVELLDAHRRATP